MENDQNELARLRALVKMNMEPKNHQIEKENHSYKPGFFGSSR